MTKGIDISHHNNDRGAIDFQKVKQAGYDFVIVKAGGAEVGYYTDSCFEKNYAGAKSAGLHVGAYYFASAFTTAEQGRIQAQKFLDIIKGKTFDFPVYVDVERFAGNPKGATDATIAFCDFMERNGYFVGIYSSDISGFKENLILDRLKDYSKWVARYGSEPKFVDGYGIWQKSETGRVEGISGNVDLNECYVNYPAIIKGAGLNGFTRAEAVVLPVAQPIVVEVEPEDVPEVERKRAIEIILKLDGKIVKADIVKIDC